MKNSYPASLFEAASCDDGREEALTLYLDGELAFGDQPSLFGHLVDCEVCRRVLGAQLEFRRMSRQEVVRVPAAADDAFLQRLDQISRRRRIDRFSDRRPLWQARAPVSIRTATLFAFLLFAAGVLFPQHLGEPMQRPRVEAVEERVELTPALRLRREAVYVFYPGLTIEAPRISQSEAESL